MSVYTPKEKEDMSASCLVLEKQFNNIIFTVFFALGCGIQIYPATNLPVYGELNSANFIQ